jgi:MscS family membrane protein
MVEYVGLRSTRIRTHDKQIVIVPNSKIVDATVTNLSMAPAHRVVVTLGLTYDTSYEDMRQALKLLRQIPQAVPQVDRKDVVASFSGYGASALEITFIYYIDRMKDIRETTSKVNFEILRMFDAAGLRFAFPTQTVYLEKNEK